MNLHQGKNKSKQTKKHPKINLKLTNRIWPEIISEVTAVCHKVEMVMKIIIITITIIMPQLPKGSDIKHVCLSICLSHT